MKRLTVLIDLDSICTDLLGAWLGAINKRYNRNVIIEDIKDWDLSANPKLADLKAPNKADKVYKIIQKDFFFWGLDVLPGSVDAVRTLSKLHDVYFLTAPAGNNSAYEKLCWVDKHFPFVGASKTIITAHKTMVQGDVLIDDKASTCVAYAAKWPESLVLTFEYPYNKGMTGPNVKVCGHYTDTVNCWANALTEIDAFAKM